MTLAGTVHAPGTKNSPITDSQLLADIHVEAAGVADVAGIRWVEHVRDVKAGRVHTHSVIRIEANGPEGADAIAEHLFGHTGRVGHWRLHHIGIPDTDLRDITVTVEDGPR